MRLKPVFEHSVRDLTTITARLNSWKEQQRLFVCLILLICF